MSIGNAKRHVINRFADTLLSYTSKDLRYFYLGTGFESIHKRFYFVNLYVQIKPENRVSLL